MTTGTAKVWLGLAFAWAAVIFFLVVPLIRPRGDYLWSHYRIRDLLLGVCAAMTAAVWTGIRLAAPSRRRAVALRLTTVCLATIVAVAGFDITVSLWRIYASNTWNDRWGVSPDINILLDPELGYTRKPGIRWHGRISPRVREIDYHGDEHGFRNPDGVTSADIVFIGDSFTEANEVPENDTFVRQVSRLTGMRAVNLGRSGYGPPQELIVLRKFGLSYHPKFAVWQICEGNDLDDAERFTEWKTNPEAFYRKVRPKSFGERYAESSVLLHLLDKTCPGPGVSIRHRDGQTEQLPFLEPYVPDAPARHPLGIAAIERSIMDALDLCRRPGIRPLVLFMPIRDRVLAPYLLFRDARQRDTFLPGGRSQDRRDFGSTLSRFCKKVGCPFLDLYPPLKSRAEQDNRYLYFMGDTHLDIEGHEVVAGAVAEWIRSAALNAHHPTTGL